MDNLFFQEQQQPHFTFFDSSCSLVHELYFERQISSQCGKHAINNLLQEEATNEQRLQKIAAELSENLGNEFNFATFDGNYECDVLEYQLKEYGLVTERLTQLLTDGTDQFLNKEWTLGFLINDVERQHWFVIRRVLGPEKYIELESLNRQPRAFTNTGALAIFLNSYFGSGSTIMRVYADPSVFGKRKRCRTTRLRNIV